jgi:hypothetical protein
VVLCIRLRLEFVNSQPSSGNLAQAVYAFGPNSGPSDLGYREAVSNTAYRAQHRALAYRMARNGLIVGGLIAAALGVGAAGYHVLDDLPWLDATLNAAMILTGMGPASPLVRPEAKVFAIVYALLSAVFFLTMVAVLLAPALQHFLHRFHLELEEQRRTAASSPYRDSNRRS